MQFEQVIYPDNDWMSGHHGGSQVVETVHLRYEGGDAPEYRKASEAVFSPTVVSTVGALPDGLLMLATRVYGHTLPKRYWPDLSLNAIRVPLVGPLDVRSTVCSLEWGTRNLSPIVVSVPVLYDNKLTIWVPEPCDRCGTLVVLHIQYVKMSWDQRVRRITDGAL